MSTKSPFEFVVSYYEFTRLFCSQKAGVKCLYESFQVYKGYLYKKTTGVKCPYKIFLVYKRY